MKISMTDLLYALSFALDSVEHDLLGVTTYHAGRVAFLCAQTGRAFDLSDQQRLDLACAALLHDNALTEYAKSEYSQGVDLLGLHEAGQSFPDLGTHCTLGERNIEHMPFFPRVRGAVLYHHENADGSGPFGLSAAETPLYAQIVHLCDVLDLRFSYGTSEVGKFDRTHAFLEGGRGRLFSDEVVDAFEERVTPGMLEGLDTTHPDDLLHYQLPYVEREYGNDDLTHIADFFARITDYKSRFTHDHSQGVADKSRAMAQFYGLGDDLAAKIYLAGALHDIGKLIISEDVLEKPAALTHDEYTYIQTHAWYTFEILRKVAGLEDVTRWASLHHEKLDGSGYPFGKHAIELSGIDRLMGCVDIYQALTEERPYRGGMLHRQAIEIMRDMAANGKIDGAIVDDIDACFAS